MSTPLQITYQGAGASLYAVLRRRSDGYAFNGSAFEAWQDAHLSAYAVALSDEGGDLYALAVPAAVVPGDYAALFYERAGGAPAGDDLLLDRRDFRWDGQAATDGSDVALSPYALTTLDDLKLYLSLTTTADDTLLTALINDVSAQVERVTGRRFKARDYRLWLNGNRQQRLTLPVYPLQYVTRVTWGVANAITLTYVGSGIRATASVFRDPERPDAGGLRLVTVSPSGVSTATNLSFADYPSVSVLAGAVNAVGGWTASVLTNVPTADLHRTGGESAIGRGVILTYPDQDENSYSVNEQTGQIEFSDRSGWWMVNHACGKFPRGHQDILVEVRAGYEEIPGDVALVCRELVKEFYQLRTQNTAALSQKVGPFAITFRDNHAQYVRDRLAVFIDASSLVGGSE